MISWIGENFASIVLLLILAAIVFFLIRSKIRERKHGTCSCSCGCGCAGCSGCASRKKEDEKL